MPGFKRRFGFVHCRNIFSGKCICGITDEKTRFTHRTKNDAKSVYKFSHLARIRILLPSSYRVFSNNIAPLRGNPFGIPGSNALRRPTGGGGKAGREGKKKGTLVPVSNHNAFDRLHNRNFGVKERERG